MKFLYGINETFIDITSIVLEKSVQSTIAYLPSNDNRRGELFTDPVHNVVKVIKIIKDTEEIILPHSSQAFIDMVTREIYIDNPPEYIQKLFPNEFLQQILQTIHHSLQFKHGNLWDELPEQLMALRFLTGNEKVLEIGANIGRNTLVIQTILNKKNNTQFVTLECDPVSAALLQENRDLNHMIFQIENAALSMKKLIQQGWTTLQNDTVLDGYTSVHTITWAELQYKYKIDFDTLVLDCEGAFYYILQDMPEILDGINMILMENDYWDIEKKQYIDEILRKNNFKCIYQEAGGWGPCFSYFYETWKK